MPSKRIYISDADFLLDHREFMEKIRAKYNKEKPMKKRATESQIMLLL